MEKENGEAGSEAAGKQDGVLDAASLFGAYWGRDGASGGGAAAAAAQAALFGFGGRYPQPSTLGVAANQAASLGLHPANAAWWSMASHLAAQDYLSRLQASGLSFPHLDPYSGMLPGQADSRANKHNKNERSGRNSSSSTSSSTSKDKIPATSVSQANMRSSYGFPKTTSPSSSALSSLASLNSAVAAAGKPSSTTRHRKPSKSNVQDRDIALLRSDLMMAQAAAQGAYHAAVAAAKGGKNVPQFNPFALGSTGKDGRHAGLESIAGLPHNLLSAALEGSDPASVLGGVRLPPDTEIIKYTSSMQGSKSTGGASSGRGRKKTISLDPPQVSVLPSTLDRNSTVPSKRQKMDNDYSNQNSSGGAAGGGRSGVEVIPLPSRSQSRSSATQPFNMSDYAGLSKELLQSIANQSGLSLAALERELAGSTSGGSSGGLDLSSKVSNTSSDTPLDLGASSSLPANVDDDAPLNLSLKPSSTVSSAASDALSRLTSLSSTLNAGSSNADRISRRKPGAKPRRVLQDGDAPQIESPRPKSSGSEDSESVGGWNAVGREGRPRNLGRGVSKPKKNTVASLLAQSRALGLRPKLAQQLAQETDVEKLRALLGDAVSTDSECPSDSPSDSDASEAGNRRVSDTLLRLPLAMGWNRVTTMKGLSRSGYIKGDVSYSPPDPHSTIKIRSAQELAAYLEQSPCSPLTPDNFSFSARRVLGQYRQAGADDDSLQSETEILKRLEEARALAALSSMAAGRRTPPPVDRRIELARQQQAARDAKRDATQRERDQARFVRELERSEKAEHARREKEARNQQMLEAKKRKQEEAERQKMEEQAKRQQEREMKRQQAVLLKEQERERRRQHTALVRQLDLRKRWEERERRKHQNLMDRLLAKEKKLQARRAEMRLLAELRRPQEDSTLSDQKALPTLNRIPGLKLPGAAMGDILQVVEFIHNFGQTLGFDMGSLPTLNTLQMALLPDCCPDAEEELVTLLTHLLVCAIEDPGIPHPGRYTTLLGHALRISDISSNNISEVLRIYLFANATGEVKAITGINQERERERRVADHHQTEEEMNSACNNTKNKAYYEHLHANATYKLSEALRDKPFLALSATTKARILAFICDELLQNKAVLRQIEASLERLNRLRKERLVQDMKIRKVRALHQRKLRSEQTEKQQALAIERMQRLVEESASGEPRPATPHEDNDHSMGPPSNPGPADSASSESSPCKELTEHADEDNPGDKEIRGSKLSVGKETINNNKEQAASPAEVSKVDKDSILGDSEMPLSDVESEGTQPEEDEDKNLSSEELGRKLEKLLRQSEQQFQQLTAGAHSLRATCYGQDRYWRRYWSLGSCGGVFVEGMESAQPDLLAYQRRLEAAAKQRDDRRHEAGKKRRPKARKGPKKSLSRTTSFESEANNEEEMKALTQEQELELKNIKSELNLSDHTQIIKYEPNTKGNCKLEGSPIKMEEKYIQQKQNNETDMLDIEDSIPTAFLVQKPQSQYSSQGETAEKPQEPAQNHNQPKTEPMDTSEPNEDKTDDLINNLEELRKMAEAVSQMKEESAEVKEEKVQVKDEKIDSDFAQKYLYNKIMEGRWFSILRKENSLLTNTLENADSEIKKEYPDIPEFIDNHNTCAEVIMCQGHKWDVSNNLQLLNDPSLFTLNSMVTAAQVPVSNHYPDSSLTMSGIDQETLDNEDIYLSDAQDKDDDTFEKELNFDDEKGDIAKKNSIGNALGLLNFNALSTYVTCDSPPPLQMFPDEYEQLEYCKVNGLPKKVDGNYVSKELRHGWWRITDPDMLKDLIESLHPRGVRERELHTAFIQHLTTVKDKLHIEAGDVVRTELSISHQDRVIAQHGGYPAPDPPGSYSLKTARRIESAALELVELLEERVAAASLQVKGWRPRRVALSSPTDAPHNIVHVARNKLAALEANIERRYLKPPLHSSGDVGAAIQQAESSASSPNTPEKNDSSAPEVKEGRGLPRGLVTWREAVSRCQTPAQVCMCLSALESHIAWDKSIMKANCQFCLSGDNDDQLLLCDGCDKGYHMYCFKPKMDKIPEGDWYCWECVNKARGDKVCIVCGGCSNGGGKGRLLSCTLCSRAYHQSCHYPPLNKSPRGKWYCVNCASKAPPKKPRGSTGKKRDSRRCDTSLDTSDHMVPSPTPSHASTSTTADDARSVRQSSEQPSEPPHSEPPPENGHDPPGPDGNSADFPAEETTMEEESEPPPPPPAPEVDARRNCTGGNGLDHDDASNDAEEPQEVKEVKEPKEKREGAKEKRKKDKRKHHKEKDKDKHKEKHQEKIKATPEEEDSGEDELIMCRTILDEMEAHQDAWPFLLPVNTKQFPTYKKVIRQPMDLSTIKRKLHDGSYKSKEEFADDVRQIFTNCEVFNEDESPVGQAGHGMRRFFQERFLQLQST